MFEIKDYRHGYCLSELRWDLPASAEAEVKVSACRNHGRAFCLLAPGKNPFKTREAAQQAGARFCDWIEADLARAARGKLRRQIEDRLRKGTEKELLAVAQLLGVHC